MAQKPIQGSSLAYSIGDPDAPSRHHVQYSHIFGSRAIYQDGWKASLHCPNQLFAGSIEKSEKFSENNWELYNLDQDPTERVNLARSNPTKLAELKALFEQQAQENNLYPLITWDDVRGRRLHGIKDSASFAEAAAKITRSGADQ